MPSAGKDRPEPTGPSAFTRLAIFGNLPFQRKERFSGLARYGVPDKELVTDSAQTPGQGLKDPRRSRQVRVTIAAHHPC